VTEIVQGYRARYREAFDRHLAAPAEETLHDAYELGRSAVREGLSVLDLAAVHHEALARAQQHVDTYERTIELGGEFFLESLSAYELVQRGLREAQDKALVERRHAALLRQLSSFLADTSLALDASASLEEVLQLVADHARELTRATWCTAAVDAPELHSDRLEVLAADGGGGDLEDARDLAALYTALQPSSGSVRLTSAELAADSVRSALHGGNAPEPAVHNWLAASLRSLDGREIGLIQVLDKPSIGFSDLDEAVLVQLAQMASASVERALLYGDRAKPKPPG
jgi:GAF domain-containing protein